MLWGGFALRARCAEASSDAAKHASGIRRSSRTLTEQGPTGTVGKFSGLAAAAECSKYTCSLVASDNGSNDAGVRLEEA